MTSEQEYQKPALEGAGKPHRSKSAACLGVSGGIGLALAIVGIWFASDNPTIDEWRTGQWIGNCVEGQPAPAVVTSVDLISQDAWVLVNNGIKVSLPLSTLKKIDCGSVDGVEPPTVVSAKPMLPLLLPPFAGEPEEITEASERNMEITRLKKELEIVKLKLEIAMVQKDYVEVVRSTSNGPVAMDKVSGAQREIESTQDAIELLKLRLEQAQIARTLYETLNSGSDRSSK